MITSFRPHLKKNLLNSYQVLVNLLSFQLGKGSFLIVLCLGILSFILLPHYGVSMDEATFIANVRYGFEYVSLRNPIPIDLSYYGLAFDGLAEATYQLFSFIVTGKFPGLIRISDTTYMGFIAQVAPRIPIKHTLTVLMALLAYLSVTGITYRVTKSNFAWIAPLLLALIPPFWGHSFFNPRDIPFAGLLTFCTWFGSAFVIKVKEATQTSINWFPTRNTWLSTFGFGLLIGLLTGIRIGGLAFLVFLSIAYVVISFPFKLTRYWVSQNFILVISLLLGVAITIYLSHPGMWFTPISWLKECLAYHSRHGWGGRVLFEGKFIPGKDVPWYYLPRWFSITVPEVIQISSLLGIFVVVSRYFQFNSLQKAAVVLVVQQLSFLPAVAILKGSTLYDAMRHFTFVLPAVAVFSAIAFIFLFEQSYSLLQHFSFKRKSKTIILSQLGLLFALLSPTLIDMASLHPYEYIYFNRISGGLSENYKKYETDYWALSMTQVSHWLNDSLPSLKTKKFLPGSAVLPYLDSQFELILDAPRDPFVPFYFIGFRRLLVEQMYPQCPIVYSVVRQKVALGFVKYCDSSAE